MTPETVKFLTADEAAEQLKAKTTELSKLPIARYKLPGGRMLFASPDLEAYDQQIEVEQPQPTNTDQVLSRSELAEWIRRAPATVKHWAHRGGGPEFKRGTTSADPPQYPLRNVQTWLGDCRVA